MPNPLFIGLVVYVNLKAGAVSFSVFCSHMLSYLEELCTVENIVDIPWYDELYTHWAEKLPEHVIEDHYDRFLGLLHGASPPELLILAQYWRNRLVLSEVSGSQEAIVNFSANFVLRWADGRQADCVCSPAALSSDFQFSAAVISELAGSFAQQVTELMAFPGLNRLHNTMATPCDTDKLSGLLVDLRACAQAKPSESRQEYVALVSRLSKLLGQLYGIPDPVKSQSLEWLSNGGGFTV